jgi:hypothetical protein
MYRSLGELVAGWSKNLVIGGQQSFPRWMRPLVPPMAVFGGMALWLVPPLVLLGSGAWLVAGPAPGGPAAVGPVTSQLLVWSAIAVAASAVQFGYFSLRMGAPARYGLVYPLGAAVTTFIFLRSWMRGRDVRWKGRDYRVPAAGSRP